MANDPTPSQPSGSSGVAALFVEVAPALVLWANLRVRGELRQRIDPQDLVQEVALRVCTRAADFDPARGSFRGWVFGIASRVWLELLRELARDPVGPRRRIGGDTAVHGIADTVTSISQRAAADEQVRACLSRLALLEHDDQQLLTYVGIESLSHIETARLLGIEPDACRKRWQRLRDRLREDALLQRLLAG